MNLSLKCDTTKMKHVICPYRPNDLVNYVQLWGDGRQKRTKTGETFLYASMLSSEKKPHPSWSRSSSDLCDLVAMDSEYVTGRLERDTSSFPFRVKKFLRNSSTTGRDEKECGETSISRLVKKKKWRDEKSEAMRLIRFHESHGRRDRGSRSPTVISEVSVESFSLRVSIESFFPVRKTPFLAAVSRTIAAVSRPLAGAAFRLGSIASESLQPPQLRVASEIGYIHLLARIEIFDSLERAEMHHGYQVESFSGERIYEGREIILFETSFLTAIFQSRKKNIKFLSG